LSLRPILPPHILESIVERGSPEQRRRALRAIAATERFRGQRELVPCLATSVCPGEKRRTVYDARNGTTLPGKLVRSEGGKAVKDVSVNEAYDGAGTTYDFYEEVFSRNSIDGKGMAIDSSVHYDRSYDNAFWNGRQMVYGDGDGDLFNRFTIAVDVIGHELTHGVTGCEANFDYEGEPGALNESFSDVFGSMVKQWNGKETSNKADWIIGEGLFTKKVKGVGIRSMKDPGTAYDDPVLGKDPQPASMKDFYTGYDDNGGVHINSGIPNRAFCLAAIAMGGHSWEKAGKIWYVALTERLTRTADFAACAKTTTALAAELFKKDEKKAVASAWKTVGVAG
jgi:Zn-dependent metalloprotease